MTFKLPNLSKKLKIESERIYLLITSNLPTSAVSAQDYSILTDFLFSGNKFDSARLS